MNRTFVSLPLLSLVAVIVTGFVIAALLSQGVVSRADEMMPTADTSAVDSVNREYGIVTDGYDIVRGTVEPGQNLSSLLQGCGLSAADVHAIGLKAEGTFDARRIRSGQGYAVFYTRDSVPAARYFVYEETPRTYVVFDLCDGFGVSRGTNPVEWRQMSARCRVESSLWVAMDEAGASPLLAVTLSHIFGWSVDFFGLQRGDEFRVIYEQEYVDGAALDNFRVLAASFAGGDTAIYAIPFVQDGEQLYYNTDGNSLEGAFLKAPLDFYRITSRFTNSPSWCGLCRAGQHAGLCHRRRHGHGQGLSGGRGRQLCQDTPQLGLYHYLHAPLALRQGAEGGVARQAEGSDRLCRLDGAVHGAAPRLPCL